MAAQNLLGPDYNALLGYDNIDLQHLIRAIYHAQVAVMLGNIDIFKDELRMQSNLIEIVLTPYGFSNYPGSCQTEYGSMAQARQKLDQFTPGGKSYKHHGMTGGRETRWAYQAMQMAYRTGDQSYRDSRIYFFKYFADLIKDAQTLYTGDIFQKDSDKIIYPQYHPENGSVAIFDGVQSYEKFFTNMIKEMLNASIFHKASPGYEQLIDDALTKVYKGIILPILWDEAAKEPMYKYLVSNATDSTIHWPDAGKYKTEVYAMDANGFMGIPLNQIIFDSNNGGSSSWYHMGPTAVDGFYHLTGADQDAYIQKITEMLGGDLTSATNFIKEDPWGGDMSSEWETFVAMLGSLGLLN